MSVKMTVGTDCTMTTVDRDISGSTVLLAGHPIGEPTRPEPRQSYRSDCTITVKLQLQPLHLSLSLYLLLFSQAGPLPCHVVLHFPLLVPLAITLLCCSCGCATTNPLLNPFIPLQYGCS